MNIYKGNIYLNKKKWKSTIKSLSDKDFKKLWDDEKFKDDVLKKRETYIYNKEDLPEIPDVTDIKKIVRDSGFE